MTFLFAFDCDGTLEVSGGKVKLNTLRWLVNKGHHVFIVSPSLNCLMVREFERFTPLARFRALRELKDKVSAERYVYVGDTNEDRHVALECGWEFVYADVFEEFVRRLVE